MLSCILIQVPCSLKLARFFYISEVNLSKTSSIQIYVLITVKNTIPGLCVHQILIITYYLPFTYHIETICMSTQCLPSIIFIE